MASVRSHFLRPYIKLMIKRKFGQVVDSVEQCRAMMKDAEKYAKPPKGTKVEPVDVQGTPAEWVSPPGASSDRTIFYCHGGGCMMGSPANIRDTLARIAGIAGARALSVDYRLAPEHPFPAALEDATKAYRWLLDQGVHGVAVNVDTGKAPTSLTRRGSSSSRTRWTWWADGSRSSAA